MDVTAVTVPDITQGVVVCVTPTFPETEMVGGFATMAAAIAAADGGVKAVIVALGNATGRMTPRPASQSANQQRPRTQLQQRKAGSKS